MSGLSIVMLWVYRMHLISVNKKLDKEEEVKGVTKKGFRYMI